MKAKRVELEDGKKEVAEGKKTIAEVEKVLADKSAITETEKKLTDALAQKKNVEILYSTLVAGYNTREGNLVSIDLRNDLTGAISRLQVDGVFLAVGLQPENDAFASLAKLNDWGYFDSDEGCTTQTEGLFVAGDCRSKHIRQVVTASADGAIAAMAACRFLDR